MIYKRSGAAWVSAQWKQRAAGAWVTKASVLLRVAGAWVEKNLAVSITNRSLSSAGAAALGATCTYTLNASGIVQATQSGSTTTLETWLVNGSNTNFEVRATQTSGTAITGTFGTWQVMSTSRAWSIVAGVGSTVSGTMSIEIRIAGTTTVLDTASITLTSERI